MNLVKILKISRLCLEHHFHVLCNNNPPIELVNIIMQFMVDSLRLSIHCHDNNYNILISGLVYGIPHESVNVTKTACTNLYKVPNMEKIIKMINYNKCIIYLTSNGNVYMKDVAAIRTSTPIKIIFNSNIDGNIDGNICDINHDGIYVYYLTSTNELVSSDTTLLNNAILKDMIEFSCGINTKVILKDVIQFSCGKGFIAALTKEGCYSWGKNERGQLGLNDRVSREHPTLISLKDVKMVACGDYHCVALCNNGDVYTWGENTYGQLGNSKVPINNILKKPAKINIYNIVDIKCTRKASIFLNELRNVLFTTPTNGIQVLNVSDVIMIDANQNTAMFMTKSLHVYTLEQHLFHFTP